MKNKKKKVTQKELMQDFDEFTQAMKSGLKFGLKKYGTEGFLADNNLKMIEEEARDVANYSYMLYRKVRMLRQRLLTLEDVKEFTKEKSKNESRY
jgi:hypothetical protein